jgi:hypothetical protein
MGVKARVVWWVVLQKVDEKDAVAQVNKLRGLAGSHAIDLWWVQTPPRQPSEKHAARDAGHPNPGGQWLAALGSRWRLRWSARAAGAEPRLVVRHSLFRAIAITHPARLRNPASQFQDTQVASGNASNEGCSVAATPSRMTIREDLVASAAKCELDSPSSS